VFVCQEKKSPIIPALTDGVFTAIEDKKITKNYERTIVVGDIHGCYLEFERLLREVSFSVNDFLITVGDMVDRGPGTWDVVKFFHATPNAYSYQFPFEVVHLFFLTSFTLKKKQKIMI